MFGKLTVSTVPEYEAWAKSKAPSPAVTAVVPPSPVAMNQK
jgi:hypothetical protein